MNAWVNPQTPKPAPRRPYDEAAVARESEAAEKTRTAIAKAVAARHPSAYAMWADTPEPEPTGAELREGVPPHLQGTI